MIGIDTRDDSFVQILKNSGIIKSYVLVICIIKKKDLDDTVGFIIFGKPSFLPRMTNHLKWTKMIQIGYLFIP